MVLNRTEVQIFSSFLGWGLSVAVGAAGNGNWKEGKTTVPTTAPSHALEMGHCTGTALILHIHSSSVLHTPDRVWDWDDTYKVIKHPELEGTHRDH